ncbi:MAG: carboxymuconolactone decarboxylase family protein [Rubrivivax sp.]
MSFPLPDLDTLPEALRQEVANRRSLNVYRMIMHTPVVAPAFLAMADALRHRTSLPGDWRELAILRVGHRYQAPYEVHHHERIGRSLGLSESALAGVRPGADAGALDERQHAVVQLTDQLLDRHGLDAASRSAALAWMSAQQLADLVLTVGFYQLVCNFLATFEVAVEA